MTNLRYSLNIVLVASLIGLHVDVYGQSRHVRQREKELGEKAEDRDAEQAAKEAEAKERHLSIQTKQTRKEMKAYTKKSKQYNNNKRKLFRFRNRR